MGVPKFYRWISERYPCLSEVVKEFQIPEFDNLYLDMNGIIHVCSHPEDDNPHFRITEEKIFADIMYYLEFLFRMIKPRKVFFMAVDGVAPRAKMNQQRGRRFRSAREAEELEKRAMQKGETLPTEKRFDSNCITPGTPFMVRLQEQLKYFVVKKISTDPLWHGVRVYLSGHETPGEGEHKIMDFIRAERAMPDYDANTRHCLYGLDADLMMLGLASHEPHFSLLREEVRFGGKKDSRNNKRPQTPEETTFHLLHLSLFREYLEFEFSALKEKATTFEFNLENVIDDWVLMGFLVGNDFIPHLPNLHINHDALPLLWKTYIEVLPSCGGYLNIGGYLNLERFELYLAALSKFDFDTFSEQAGDLKWLESKKSGASADKAELMSAARKLAKNQSKTVRGFSKQQQNQFAFLEAFDDEMLDPEELGTQLIDPPLDETPEEVSEDISEESDEDTLGDEFRQHKRHYYMTKLEYEKVTPEVLQDQAEGYVMGIQWILLYYYEGVPSWSWFYKHHYAPYMSDVKDFKDMDLQFDLGTPFMPFEQLMAVLPAASKELLPNPYQALMINDSSPVIDFYPLKFDTDLNGKQQDWEAVVLIPFIDENRLLSAIRSVEHLLTDSERSRNRHGPHMLYEYNEEPGDVYSSPIPDHFPDIALNHSKLTEVRMDEFRIPSGDLKKGMLPGAKLDVFFPGFPTLKHIPHRSELSKEGVKVFQMNSRGYNTMLHIQSDGAEPDIDRVANEYLGKEIYVGWPHLYEAKVVAVCDAEFSYSHVESEGHKGKSGHHRTQVRREQIDESTFTIWIKEKNTIAERYKDRLGIVVGDTHILLRALPMTGRKYIFSSHGRVTMDKQFGNLPVAFALQATVKDIAVHDPGFCQFKTLKEYLPECCAVFMLGWPHYGCQGEVLETDTDSGRVRINLSILEEPRLSDVINQQQVHTDHYYAGFVIAQKLGISSHLLSRLTGTIFVTAGEAELAKEQKNPHKVNVGLNLKFTKRGEEVPGYTKHVEGHWTYSDKTADVLRQYMARFTEMFEIISKSNSQSNDMFYESDVIPKTCDYTLKTVEEYVKGLPCSSLKPVKSGADIISEGVILALQQLTDKTVEVNKKRQKRVKMQVKPHLLYKPMQTAGALIPDSTVSYQLFDRVLNIRQGFPVPFGLRGTVVGIHPAELEVNTMFEVVFDEEFQGGIAIRNSSKRGYRMPTSGLLNLSHGDRKNGAKPANFGLTAAKNPAHQGHQYKNVSSDFSYANATTSRNNQYNQGYQGQQNYHRNQGGYQDNRAGHQDNQYSRGGNQQWERQPRAAYQGSNQRQGDQYDRPYHRNTQDTKEDMTGKVFNGASAVSNQPRFVTPKVTQGNQSQRKLSTGDTQQNKPPNSGTSTNSEFGNIWKQLQSSEPPADISAQGTSLSIAAAVLPRVPSPETSKGSDTNHNAMQIDVQSLFSGASSGKDVKSKPSGDSKAKPKNTKVVSNDEFAAMFKSLEEVQAVQEEKNKEAEESSELLKKMLKIDDQSEASESTEPPSSSGSGKSYGRQLSVQELFDGAKKQQVQPDPAKPQESQKRGKGYQKNKGQGHQSPRQQQGYQGQQSPRQSQSHQSQQQNFQSNAQNKRPTLLMPPSKGGNRNPVMELMSFCQSLQMGLPMYDYIPKGGLHYCVVSLFSGARFQGSMCKTKEEAAESAASFALLQLRGSMQQMAAHSMMQMPGFMQGAMQQGRQFSSPNSAFSPVSNFPGFYQGSQGQGSKGHQQQQPYSGGQGHSQHSRGGHHKQQTGSHFNPANEQQNQTAASQNSQLSVTNQNVETRNDERSLVNTSSNQKQNKEVKTQPTCVVTPFVPMQVTRKQTPQKPRKESVSDESSPRQEEEKYGKGEVTSINENISMQPSKTSVSSATEHVVDTSVDSDSKIETLGYGAVNTMGSDSTRKKSDSESKKQTTPPKTAKSPETSSAKKSRRRLAANFNFNA